MTRAISLRLSNVASLGDDFVTSTGHARAHAQGRWLALCGIRAIARGLIVLLVAITATTIQAAPLPFAPAVDKAFAPANIAIGAISQMTITLSNPNQSSDITGVQLTDSYPAGMANAPSGVVVGNSCGGSVAAAANGSSTALANSTIPAGGTCDIVINVIGTSVGSSVNHTGAVTSTNAPSGADASATLTVTSGVPLAAPIVTEAFAANSAVVGGTSQLVISLNNLNNANSAITGVQFTDNYPAPLHMANAASGVVVSNTCGGTVTAAPNGTSVILSNGTIPANTACSVYINVVGTSVGTSVNHTGAVTSTNANPGVDATATLTVTNGALLPAPRVDKSFTPASVLVGGFSQMKVTLTNTDANNAVIGAQFNDLYPAGMVSAPNSVVVSNTCVGAGFVPANTFLRLNNATIPAGGSCSIVVNVVGAVAGAWTNQTGVVLSGNAQIGSSASATLTVTNGALLSQPLVSKVFAPASMIFGDTSQMTIALTNTDPNNAIAGAQFTDIYPGGMANAPSGVVVSNTCGGIVIAAVDGPSAALVNGTISAGSTCSVVVDVVGIWVGASDNSTGLIKSGNAQSGGPAIATLTVTNNPALLDPPTVFKKFTPANVTVGGTSQMKITLINADFSNAVTGVHFTDIYPAGPSGMANASSGAVVNNDCGGTVTAVPNGNSTALTNGTIPAGGLCSVVINVVGTAMGAYVNHTGAVTSANANAGADASANLTIASGSLLSAPTVTKAFAPASVTIGSASQMTITLSNSDPSNAITGAQFTDAYPAGMVNAPNGVVVNDSCGTATAAANGSSVALVNGTVPAGGSCSVVINVVGTSVGSFVNHTGAVTSANATTGVDAAATLTVAAPLPAPIVTKAFAPASVTVGGTSQMTITLNNSDPNTAITGVQFTDSYPAPLHMANASSGVVVSNTCGGTVTAAASGTSTALANGTIPVGGTCSVVVNVVGTSAGNSVNHTGAVLSADANAGTDASATLTVAAGSQLAAPTVTKAFAPGSVIVGGISQMTITLSNPNANNAITGAQFTDAYPAGMANALSGAVVSNTCGGTVTATANFTSATLANGTIPAGGMCSVVINIVGTSAGSSVNHTGAVLSANANAGTDASATLTVAAGSLLTAPTVTKAFAPATVTVGGTSQMTITLTNPNPNNAITGAQFTDAYPAGMANALSGVVVSNSCGGSVTASANGTSMALANGTIAAGSACSVVIDAVGTAVGGSNNQTGPVLSSNVSSGASANAILTVTSGNLLAAPTVTKAFAPGSVTVGGTSQITITLSNPSPNTAITGAQFTDSYPAGMANAATGAIVSNNCGGTVTAAANSTSMALANGTIAAANACSVVIDVVATSAGSFINHTGVVTSANASPGVDAAATLTVTSGNLLSAPTVTKTFAPGSVTVGGTSQMTITLSNANGSAIAGAQFTDIYPAGIANASNNAVVSTTCGAVIAMPNDISASLVNGIVPAGGTCSVVVNVVGTSVGSAVNHTGTVLSSNAHIGADANATLIVNSNPTLGAPNVSKAFAPPSVIVGGTSQMTITLSNPDPNNAITGAQFTDNYPSGMANAPSGAVVSNTCGGSLVASANNLAVSLANGTIPANDSCSVAINVVGTSAGSSVNHTGPVPNANANAGTDATATLEVALLTAPTVTKAFAPVSVTLGGTSQMVIELVNTDPNNAVTGVQFTDNYPSGMVNASSGVVVNNSCGGTVTAAPNGTSVALSNGTIPANQTCAVWINVVGTSVGTSVNHTGVVTSANANLGADAAATLTVTNGALLSAPTVTKAFAPANVVVGGASQMTITLTNTDANTAVTGAQFNDLYPAGMVNAPNSVVVSNSCGGSLFPWNTSLQMSSATIPASGSCSIVVNVVGAAIGTWTNQTGAVPSGNAQTGGGASATLTVMNGTLLLQPLVTKAFAPASVTNGGTSQMTLTLTNTNPNNAITGAQFTDTYPPGMANAASGAIASNTCGGIVTAVANGTSTGLANGTIAPGGTCSVVINVVGTAVGTSTNSTGLIKSGNAQSGGPALATLTVTDNPALLSAPTVTKAFAPTTVTIGGTSQMVIALVNTDPNNAITGVQFTDNYPAPLHMANAPGGVLVNNTCGGTVIAAPNGMSTALANGAIQAGGTCNVVINVVGTSVGSSVNHTGAVGSDNANAGADASATLTVANGVLLPAPTVAKGFAPASVPVGGSSQMTITLSSPDPSTAVTGAQFTDAYPMGIANAPSGVLVSNTCGGTVTAAPSGMSLALANGTIPAGGSCNVVINVVGTSVGSSINHTGAVISANANAGADASGTLTVTNGSLLTAPVVTKAFAPASVPVGGGSQMTITLSNQNGSAITGAQFTDSYPPGMANAAGGVVASNTCGGAVTATPGWMSTALTNGIVPASGTCSVVISVVGTSVGTTVNHTGAVSSANANSGADATATLTVTGAGNNHSPVAVGDAIDVASNGIANTLVGDPNIPSSVLDNDIDSDGDTLTATKLSAPTHGSLSFGSDGQFTYQNDGSGTTDSFTYKACDASVCSAETKVTITIGNGLNNHVPFATDDSIEVVPGGTATTLVGDPKNPSSVLDNDSDPDAGDALTASKLSDPTHAALFQFNTDGTFTYQNDGSAATTDAFLYSVCDNHGACSLGVVTITVGNGSTNHLPIVVDDAIQVAPNGQAHTLIGDLNDPSSVLDNDADPDAGDTLMTGATCDLLNASGSMVLDVDGKFTYQNMDPQASSDMCLYQACDPHGACSTGIVHISITNGPLDLAPIGMDDAIEVAPNGTTSTLVGDPNIPNSVLDNDNDPNDAHNTLKAYLISAPANGHVALSSDGTFTYVNTNPIADAFQYEVCDPAGACVAATVSVTINGSAPTVSCVLPTQVDVVGDLVALDLSLLFTPPAGQTLTYSATNPPPTLSILGSLLTGTLTTSGTYTAALNATTSPGGVSASENVIFQVLPAGEILLRNGFDNSSQSQPCP